MLAHDIFHKDPEQRGRNRMRWFLHSSGPETNYEEELWVGVTLNGVEVEDDNPDERSPDAYET